MLRYILDTHPEICCPGQLFLGSLCQALYTAAYYTLGQVSCMDDDAGKRRVALGEVRDVTRKLMGRYASAKGKRVWSEKTTANIEYLRILDDTFPEARYILLFRHCLDVVHSCLKTSRFGFMEELAPYVARSPQNLIRAALENWIEKTRKLLEFDGVHKGRTHRMTYETLVLDPIKALPAMFEFIGVEWDKTLLDRCFHIPHDPGEGDTKVIFDTAIHANSIGKGAVLPAALIPDGLRAEADYLLLQLGYQSIGDYFDFYGEREEAIDVGSSGSSANVSGIHERLETLLSSRAPKTRKSKNLAGRVCKIVIPDLVDGVWVIDSSAPEGIDRSRSRVATCTISLNSDLLVKIVDRKENPVEAYEDGRLQVTGNLDTALEFGRILFA